MYTYPPSSDLTFEVQGSIPVSSALGGLSTVWGSNIQGFRWPDQFNEYNIGFSDSLNSTISLIPSTGSKDDLEKIYTWPEPFKDSTNLSKRSKRINNRFKANEKWVLGEARNSTAGAKTGCTKCGLCLTGCPEDVIFSTESLIKQMVASGEIFYIEAQVTSLKKLSDKWGIELYDLNSQSNNSVSSKFIYLAAGSIASAIILSRSELIPSNAQLEDTQVIYLPLLSFRDPAEIRTNFSLAQLFLETTIGLFHSDSLHVSIYEHSESFRDRATILFPKIAPHIPNFVYRRLMAGIAFLPPQKSGKICIERKNSHITVSLIDNPFLRKTIKNCLKELKKPLIQVGLLPIRAFTSLGNTGASYHVGNLTSNETKLIDHLGNLRNCTDLYIVDGSALPTIPAGPVTLGIMANSRRITLASLKR